MSRLSVIFLEHVPESRREACAALSDLALSDLTRRLARCLTEGRDRWPGVENDDGEAVAFFAERLSQEPDTSAEEAVESLRTADLYLTCACLRGDATAVKTFRDAFEPVIQRALARFGDQEFIQEISQQLLTRLLVGSKTKPGDIAKYHGSGQLAGWLQIAAIREATNAVTRGPRERPSDMDMLVDRAIIVEDPELEILKRKYRGQFKLAFQKAFGKLESRGRNLLRHQYLDGLNLEKMALLYGVGRSTVARWRSQARDDLFKHTREFFAAELNVSRGEFDSIMRLIDSQLDASLSRILRP